MPIQSRVLIVLLAAAVLAATGAATPRDSGNTPDSVAGAVKAATARRIKLERMREMLELELAELEADEVAKTGLAELEAIDDAVMAAAAEAATTVAAAAKAETVAIVDDDTGASAEASIRHVIHTTNHQHYDTNATSSDEASGASQAAENKTAQPKNPSTTAAAEASRMGESCIPGSRMASVVSYQQGVAGVEWLDDMFFEPETAAVEAEIDDLAVSLVDFAFTTATVTAPAPAIATPSSSPDDDDSAGNSTPYPISELVLVELLTTTAPTPTIKVAPRTLAPAIGADSGTGTSTRVISSRAKAALLKAKAAKRASKATKTTKQATGTSDPVYAAMASASAPTPTIREIRNRTTPEPNRDRGTNHQAVPGSSTSILAGRGQPNSSAEDVAPNVVPDVTIAIKPAPMVDPVAAAAGKRHTSSSSSSSSARKMSDAGGDVDGRPAGFMSGFLSTLTVILVVVAGGAGLAYYVATARQEEARAQQSRRRISMAPLLYRGEASSTTSLQFGQLRQRGARNAWDAQGLPI